MIRFAWVGLAAVCLQCACSRSPEAYVERANGLMAAGKDADAEILYRKAVAKDPKYAEGYYRLGLLEYKLRRPGVALEDLQRAVDFDATNDRYGIELASVAIEVYQIAPNRQNFYNLAAQEADVLLKKDPNSFDGLRLRGDVLAIDRKYDEALAELHKADAIKPNDPNVIMAMMQIFFARNRDQEGEQLAQQFLNVRKDSPPVYDLLENHYVREKRTADAERLLQLEIAASPKDARPRLQLAGLYQQSGRYQEMTQALRNVVADRTTFPAGRALVGDFYADSKTWDQALVQYRAGLQQSSETDKVLYHKRIERALEGLGKRDEAIGELNEVLKTNPKDPDIRLARAILWRESQDPKQRELGIQELKTLAVEFPENSIVHYNLGLSYIAKSDAGAARQELRKSADLRKDYIAPRLLLAEMALKQHNYSAALDASGEALALDPNNLDARLVRGAALVGNKSYRQAEGELKVLSELQPDSKEVTLELAALAAGQKDYAKAQTLYQRVYRPGSTDLRPLQGLLEICVVERHPDQAQKLLQDELKEQPDSLPVHLLLASIATQEGKFGIAAEQYRWLQAKDPKSEQAYAALGDLYQMQGETRDALASYQKASELAPNDTKVLNAIAVLESNNGQKKEAIATLNRQLALDPDNAVAMNNLAFNLAETGQDLDRARTLAEKVVRKFPNDPGAIDTLGWVYTKRGLNQSAIQVLRALVKNYPKQPTYRYHLAVALIQDKQTSYAKRELLTALSAHPTKDLTSKIQANLTQVQ